MTVSYSDSFWKLLLRWRGSLWKTIYKDLFVFLILYYAISCVYRFVLDVNQRQTFERLVMMFNKFTEQIPLTFMLGFYVGMVVKRWWDQFQRVSWPDNFLYWISAYIRGQDEKTRLIRRTIARYCMLSSVMGWRSISTRVLKRFPTVEHIMAVGLITEQERLMYDSIQINYDPHKQWFLPLNWVLTIITRAYEEGRIEHVNELRQLIAELELYRSGFMYLFIYDWITIPLVYTQVAVVATYGYFALCLIGRQYIKPVKMDQFMFDHGYMEDLYVPIFTILQFLFYLGWLKVGEDLMNPFGEDDEDFEFNYLLDRHIEMSYLIVDEIHQQCPEMVETGLQTLDNKGIPHTKASLLINDHPPHNHAVKVQIKRADMEFVLAPFIGKSMVLKDKDLSTASLLLPRLSLGVRVPSIMSDIPDIESGANTVTSLEGYKIAPIESYNKMMTPNEGYNEGGYNSNRPSKTINRAGSEKDRRRFYRAVRRIMAMKRHEGNEAEEETCVHPFLPRPLTPVSPPKPPREKPAPWMD